MIFWEVCLIGSQIIQDGEIFLYPSPSLSATTEVMARATAAIVDYVLTSKKEAPC